MNVVRDCKYGKMAFSTLDQYVGKSYDLYGEYSEAEIKLIKQIIKPEWIAVDVGANIGALTIPMAQAVGSKGIVLAFEPQRSTYYSLCANIFLNNLSNVFAYQRAIGKDPRTVLIPDLCFQVPGNYGAFSLNKDESSYKQCNKLPVDVIRLDDLGMGECDFIKIDVEGMELEVLAGATKTIEAKRPIMYIEDDRKEMVAPLLDMLKHFKYQAWQHFPPLFNPDNMKKNQNNVFNNEVSANLLCVPFEKSISEDITKDLQPVLKAN